MRAHRVLLVDDDEDYTAFVRRLLARIGYDAPLDVAHDEQSALEALHRQQYDVVVSDYDLNPGSGVRVLVHVRKLWPRAQRILLTSAPDVARDELDKHQAPADGVWDKRWELGTIRDQLRTLLQPRP
jgi:DNA-binding response OmpR family regulator